MGPQDQGSRRQGSALALLLLAACGTLPPSGPKPPPPPPSLEGAVVFEARTDEPTALEGARVPIRIRIANRVEGKVVVLQDARILRNGTEITQLSWQTSRPGTLDFDRPRDAYTYLTATAPPTQPVFNTGVLLPREEMTLALPVRALGTRWTVEARYFLLDAAELAEHGYFPRPPGAFVRADPAALRDRFPAVEGGARRLPVVLFIPSVRLKAPNAVSRDLALTLRPRDFPLSDAVRRLHGQAVTDYTFSELAGGWIFQTPDGTLLVRRDGTELFPPVSSAVFDAADDVAGDSLEIEFHKASYTLFEDRVALVIRDDIPVGFIPKSEFLPMLRTLAEAREKLRVAYRVELTYRNGNPIPTVVY